MRSTRFFHEVATPSMPSDYPGRKRDVRYLEKAHVSLKQYLQVCMINGLTLSLLASFGNTIVSSPIL